MVTKPNIMIILLACAITLEEYFRDVFGEEMSHCDVTVYHMIWYNEYKQCIISYGFTERIEPVNNLI